MALRGIKPQAVEKRLKAFFYGPAGVGKTTAAIQFPKPYLIDTERGAENKEYADRLSEAGGSYVFLNDFDEIIKETHSLMTERHPFKTVIIDPITVPYNDSLDREAQRLAQFATDPGSDGSEFGRNKKGPDRKVRHLINLLLRLDMNVIITSHAKVKWEKSGKDFKEAGSTFDAYGKLDYLFDLVFEVAKRGGDRVGIVRKTRCAAFPDGDIFSFSYQEIASRYGQDILERSAQTETFATPEEAAEVRRLIALLNVPEERYSKWLDKAMAADWNEMPSDAIGKTIEYLKNQVNSNAA